MATCKVGFAAGVTGAPTVTCTATSGTAVWSTASGTCVQGETMAGVMIAHGIPEGALCPFGWHLTQDSLSYNGGVVITQRSHTGLSSTH